MSDPDEDPREHVRPQPDLVTWKPSYITLEDLRVDPADVTQFLAQLAVSGNVSEACRVSKLSRANVYKLRRNVPEFKQAWSEAIKHARDNLEREAYRRAVEGVKRTVYQGGRAVGTVVEYSDSLLTTMLRARHPAYAKTGGGTQVNVDARDQSQNLTVGPPVPNEGDLGQFVKRLSEIAQQQGIVPEGDDGV